MAEQEEAVAREAKHVLAQNVAQSPLGRSHSLSKDLPHGQRRPLDQALQKAGVVIGKGHEPYDFGWRATNLPSREDREIDGVGDAVAREVPRPATLTVRSLGGWASASLLRPNFEESLVGAMHRLRARPARRVPQVEVPQRPDGVDIEDVDEAIAEGPGAVRWLEGADRAVAEVGVARADPHRQRHGIRPERPAADDALRARHADKEDGVFAQVG